MQHSWINGDIPYLHRQSSSSSVWHHSVVVVCCPGIPYLWLRYHHRYHLPRTTNNHHPPPTMLSVSTTISGPLVSSDCKIASRLLRTTTWLPSSYYYRRLLHQRSVKTLSSFIEYLLHTCPVRSTEYQFNCSVAIFYRTNSSLLSIALINFIAT